VIYLYLDSFRSRMIALRKQLFHRSSENTPSEKASSGSPA